VTGAGSKEYAGARKEKKIWSLEKFWSHKKLVARKFGRTKIGRSKILVARKFWSLENFGRTKIWSHENESRESWSLENWSRKKFWSLEKWSLENFGRSKSGRSKNFGRSKSWSLKSLVARKVVAQMRSLEKVWSLEKLFVRSLKNCLSARKEIVCPLETKREPRSVFWKWRWRWAL
jgi:hypothetical protein